MQKSVRPDMSIDARGMFCPVPVLKTSEAMGLLKAGQVLELLATDPASKPDLKNFCNRTGHELLSVSEEGTEPKVFMFLIRKKHP